jgi:hypothetical protein
LPGWTHGIVIQGFAIGKVVGVVVTVHPGKALRTQNRSRNFHNSMNRQITVSSGGCVQARCGTIGILTVLLTLDDALLHLLGKAAIFALPQMDLAFHRYIPEFANVPDVMRGNLR